MKKNAINEKKNNKKNKLSGVPMAYDEDKIYVDSRNFHSLIIGTMHSGKTQVITLPMLKIASLAEESIIIHDSNDEIYEKTKDMFKENQYNIIKLDFNDNTDTNCWNPLAIAKKYYDLGNFDKACDCIEKVGYYLIRDIDDECDSFWINSAVRYFTGICLYVLEKEKDINLTTIYNIDMIIRENPKKFIKNLEKYSAVYISLCGILSSPLETMESIFSIFDSKFKKLFIKRNLKEMLLKNDFDISRVSKEKTIIYIKSGKSDLSNKLFSLFIDQVYNSKNDKNKLNIIIDDFYTISPIKDFSKILNYSRSLCISFIIMIRGFNDLKNVYGKEEYEMIRLCFTNIVYLLSQDFETLEEISKLCGNKDKYTPLISISELKTIKQFEAIIITARLMPFKTNLIPYFQIKKT